LALVCCRYDTANPSGLSASACSLSSGLARPNFATSIPSVAQLGLPLPTNHCLLRQTSAVAPRFQDCPSVRSEPTRPPGTIPTSDSKLRTNHKIQCNCVRNSNPRVRPPIPFSVMPYIYPHNPSFAPSYACSFLCQALLT